MSDRRHGSSGKTKLTNSVYDARMQTKETSKFVAPRWLGSGDSHGSPNFWLVVSLAAALAALSLSIKPNSITQYYLLRQDVPFLCVIALAMTAFLRFEPARSITDAWIPTKLQTWIAILALLFVCIAGHWVVMNGYDMSRDEAMATLSAGQIARGSLVTPVPEEWRPYGQAMLPIFFHEKIDPHYYWTSTYLPINSAIRSMADAFADSSIVNPLLYLIGLCALWRVARVLWPDRPDAAIVAVILGGTSTQLLASSMTSYAMTGHFALNMVWLALFLRKDKFGTISSIILGLFIVGLHRFHFHILFVFPFILWIVCRREWRLATCYGVGYLAIAVFWTRVYPTWLIDNASLGLLVNDKEIGLLAQIEKYARRLINISVSYHVSNFIRFIIWNNLLLLIFSIVASFWAIRCRNIKDTLVLPILGACLIGLLLMVYQGHGWGYRYLSGLIGCFCLLAGYGWLRLVPEPGPSRAWTALKYASAFALVVQLPIQLAMARHFVTPYATLHQAALASDADIVLVDIEGGFYAQDIVQNSLDFGSFPKIMDLSWIEVNDLQRLCARYRVVRIDARHYRAVGMMEMPFPIERAPMLFAGREFLDSTECARPLKLG